MTSFKDIEIRFRRWLLHLMGMLMRRGRSLPEEVDFNKCKFLFIRQDRIGDVLVSTPLFYALKHRYPNAIVDFFLSTNNHFVLQNEPLVRRRWVYTKRIGDSIRLLRAIRKERYDFVIDLMDNPSATSTVICSMAGARWNVGLMKENEFVYDVAVPLLSRRETHIVDRLAELLKVFGIDVSDVELAIRYVVAPECEQKAVVFCRENGLENRRVLGVNISAGSEVRFWGVENFRALIEKLSKNNHQLRILLLYAPADRQRAQEIAASLEQVVLTPATRSFDEFAAYVKQVQILVTPDTSAVHLAAAFKIPSVVLYVQSNKELRVWDPYRTAAAIHVTDIDDLTTIPPAEVYDSVLKFLQGAKGAPSIPLTNATVRLP